MWWRHMRKADTAYVAGQPRQSAGSRDRRPAELVCLALVLALVALFARIASIW
jgi:hypothetical protein